MKKNIAVFLTAFALIFTTAFAVLATDTYAATPKPKKIYITATSKTVDIKGTVRVSVYKTSPSNASKSVKWTTSNKKIATVSSKGTVTGKKSGTVKIYATSTKNKKVKASLSIRVKDLKPTAISLDKSSMELYVGKNGSLNATLEPVGLYNRGIEWSSSNTNVATVSGSSTTGTIKPLSDSSEPITITAKDKETKSKTATCSVMVKDLVFRTPNQASVNINNVNIFQNEARIVPAASEATVISYESSDPTIATVNSSNGTINKKKAGKTTITATAKVNDVVVDTASYVFNCYKSPVRPDKETIYGVKYLLFDFDGSKYASYKVTGIRPATGEDLEYEVEEATVQKAFGENVSVNLWDADTVGRNFPTASFDYNLGNDYRITKSGDRVTVKYRTSAGTMTTSDWYYTDKSFVQTGDNYVLTLFSESGTGKPITLNGNKLTFSIGSKSFELTRSNESAGDTIKAVITESGEATLNVSLVKNGTNYQLAIPEADADKYALDVEPGALK